MQKIIGLVVVTLLLCLTNCETNSQQKHQSRNMENIAPPMASQFVTSPLRNSISLELNAPVEDVWALVGDPAKMPAYSSGLDKVDTRKDQSGRCAGYTCYFKPIEAGGQEIVHTSKIVWFEPNKGWASLDEEPNFFGFRQSLTLITMEEKDGKTILNWAMHFNCDNEEMLQMNVSSLEEALNNEIAQKLVEKFGGKKLDSFVEGKQKP